MTPKIPALAVCLLLPGCGASAVPAPEPAAAAAPAVPFTVTGDPPHPLPQAIARAEAAREASPTPTYRELRHPSPQNEIAALEQLLATSARSSPDRPRLLRRLAEAYATLASAAHGKGVENGEAVTRAARRKAIETYALLVTDHPSWCSGAGSGCIDEVLFYLAYEHEQAGEPAEARRAYREILKSWPLSRYVPNAYLAFAEMYFEESTRDPPKLSLAEKAYKEVLRFPPPDNKVAAYAHYKLAYVHFNRGDTARALEQMGQAIAVADATPQIAGTTRLAAEARRDLLPIYAAGGDPARAYDFLSARSGDRPGESERLHRMLEALAQAYVDGGKPEAAVEVYVDWLSRGAGPKTCVVVKGIDGVIARAAGNAGTLAKVQQAAGASAPLMKARVECAGAQ